MNCGIGMAERGRDFIERADALRAQGKYQEAVAYYRKALKLNPDDSEIYEKMGWSILKRRLPEIYPISLACFRKSLEINPENFGVYMKMATLFERSGDNFQALRSLDQALALKPAYVPALFEKLNLLCPIVYEKEADLAAARQAYVRELDRMTRVIDLDDPATLESAVQAVGKYPYYLAYQAENDRDLQRQYGQLVCRIQAAAYPQWSRSLPLLPRQPGRHLRIGIVSGFFSSHSNWKMRIHGWLEQLDRDRFEIYGYHTGRRADTCTDIARRKCRRFVENDFSVPSLCQKILADQLDVLIYPEIGMNKIVIRLAALRLAPVQCTTWGNPTTSGLPTIDYFLSSDLMEPEDADEHYSETLVRLPNLSVYYLPLPPAGASVLTRQELNLNPDAVLYLCLQSLAKYLPRHDDIFPRIAKQVGHCQFVFLTRKLSLPVVNIFKRRLDQAFTRHNLNYREYVVFLPFLNRKKYYSLNCLGDIFLDTIGWSGCNTTLEALTCDLPVVTLPGNLMRGRHTLAFLRMMGIVETIADSVDNYVKIAVRLGRDSQWRDLIRGYVAQNKHKLYRDQESIRELETFFERVGRS